MHPLLSMHIETGRSAASRVLNIVYLKRIFFVVN